MRRIRNVTNEPLSVPLLGVTVQPGDVANVPDNLDVEFSENYWEMDGSRDNEPATTDVNTSDSASTEEGTQ